MTNADLEILLNTGAFRSKPPEYAVRLLEDTCARTGLDWKARHVYLMERGGKWMVTLSIDGFRAIAAQEKDYDGQQGPFWVLAHDGTWTDVPPEGLPYAAKVGVVKGGAVTWGVAKYKDYVAGPMWAKFPSTMIAKCAEMLALRKAFPGRLGGLYGVEEMEQAKSKAQGVEHVAEEKITDSEAAWFRKLDESKTADSLKSVGKAIMADKTLSVDAIQRLHGHYTELKGKYQE